MTPEQSQFTWFSSVNGNTLTYAGGEAYRSVDGGAFTLFSNADYGFRTYITPSEVPLPAAWILMIAGAGALRTAARRRAA